MKIQFDVLKGVLMDYIEDTFSQFSPGWENMVNKIAVKLLVSNKYNSLKPMFDSDGFMNVSDLEAFLMPEVKKLGIIEVNGINKRYTFKEEDFLKLLAQIKNRSIN